MEIEIMSSHWEKEESQTHSQRKNITPFILMFQPLFGPVSDLGDIKWYFLC